MVFQKRKYTLKLDLSFCYISYVLKMISFRLKEEKRSLDADWSRAWCRFLLFFTAPHCNNFRQIIVGYSNLYNEIELNVSLFSLNDRQIFVLNFSDVLTDDGQAMIHSFQ